MNEKKSMYINNRLIMNFYDYELSQLPKKWQKLHVDMTQKILYQQV